MRYDTISHECRRVRASGIYTNGNVPNNTVRIILPIHRNDSQLGEPSIDGLGCIDGVLCVGGPLDLGMRDVRFSRHQILRQVIRQEDLTRVGSGISLDGPVGLEHPILVDLHNIVSQNSVSKNFGMTPIYLNVNMHGPLDVESWNDRPHLHHAVRICGPHSSEGGVVGVKFKIIIKQWYNSIPQAALQRVYLPLVRRWLTLGLISEQAG